MTAIKRSWNAVWLGVWTAGSFMAVMLPAHAVISAVNPAEGTVGTQFTILGTDFGDKKGTALLGTEPLKVRDWTDTQISVEVWKAQPAGDYTVSVSPKEKKKNATAPQTFSPFVLQSPMIDEGEPLRLITPLEVITITGDFFGKKTGRVGMRDTTGLTLECTVYDWSPNSITFQVPAGLTGTVALGVKNDVGVGIQRFWGTFTYVPPMPKLVRTAFLKETHENARGIYFEGKLWMFMTQKDLAFDKENDIWAGWFDSRAVVIDDKTDDPGGYSDAQVTPIVIDHQLWVFVTGEDGRLYYKKNHLVIEPGSIEPSWKWEDDYHRIPGTGTDATMELAPVWNPKTRRLEVFYWNSGDIYRVYSDNKGATWSSTAKVAGLGTVRTAPSAALWNKDDGTTVTLLVIAGPTTPDTSNIYYNFTKLYALKDGVVQGTGPIAWSPFHTGQPFIGDLGEDYFGVVFENLATNRIDLGKMNKHTGAWSYNPLVPIVDQNTLRDPSFAVNLEERPDPDNPATAISRYDAVAYVFWDDNGLGTTGALMSSFEFLGWWQEDGVTETDTGASSTRTAMFDLWQVVGVVDAPPYVLNGSPYAEECDLWTCNSSTFGNTQSEATTFSFDFKMGAYFETGEDSPMKLELTASLDAQYSHTNTKTVDVATTLFRSKEGLVSVFYLAPKFRSHHIQWYDLTGNATGNYIQQIEFVDAQLLSQEFDPRGYPWPDLHSLPPTYFDPVKFPIHASEDDTAAGDRARLDTYSATPPSEFEPWFQNALYWNRGAEKHLNWVLSEETTDYIGGIIKYKIGMNIKKYFGFGIEGEFSCGWETRATVDNHSELALVPGSSVGEPFHSFRVDAYWLKPDPNGYWLPLNRRGSGDAPWFITYRVSDIIAGP